MSAHRIDFRMSVEDHERVADHLVIAKYHFDQAYKIMQEYFPKSHPVRAAASKIWCWGRPSIWRTMLKHLSVDLSAAMHGGRDLRDLYFGGVWNYPSAVRAAAKKVESAGHVGA